MSQGTTLVWGAANWLWLAAPIAIVMLLLLAWGYWTASGSRRLRLCAAALKSVGIFILLLCLLDPLLSGTRARPGANQFVVLADNSQSMTLRDRGAEQSRAQQLKSMAGKSSSWLARLGQDFDLRQYAFDTQLRVVPGLDEMDFDGRSSSLGDSLTQLYNRYKGRPLAGIILLTDGNATDSEAVDRLLSQQASANVDSRMPPIYPVIVGGDEPSNDVSLQRVTVTQTNFEDAPVTLLAQVQTSGYRGRNILVRLHDNEGRQLDQQKLRVDQDGEPITARFRFRPEKPGVSFFRVSAMLEGAELPIAPATSPANQPSSQAGDEATLSNNTRIVAVDRGQGPYRVLYISGRPNWEYKFLQRALAADSQVQLSALIRIAKREPKFNYLGHNGEAFNPLFRGFNNNDPDQVEQYDKPVVIKMPFDEHELQNGFPKTPEEMYRFHAVVIDDVESEFFTQDQMLLLKEFVRQRGGGLIMLGGEETFKDGKYDRTPLGDLLPVYADDSTPDLPADVNVRMSLTREGWLEPWIRLRPEEEAEKQRLNAMPGFNIINPVRGIKPGATVLARAEIENSEPVPALVEQRFGRGRSAALLIGDLWRWDLHRPANSENDLAKAWRQTFRWLLSEVPQRLEISTAGQLRSEDPEGAMRLQIRVRDAAYAPLDNATVNLKITSPDGKSIDLSTEPGDREAGVYEAVYVPRQTGAYLMHAAVTGPDGADVGQAEAGWTSDPAAEEFQNLKPNRALLDRIAKSTGGQVIRPADMDSFVATLPTLHAQITEPYIRPFWHQAGIFLLAILCLTAEWGLRRWQGLP